VAEFDAFADQLWEESKRFFEKASDSAEKAAQDAYLHASLMLSFCALEARVNSISDEASLRGDLSAHERALVLERDVRLQEGKFEVHSGLKIVRLEDRIEFLHTKLSGKPIDKSVSWWGQLQAAIHLRNDLTHAKAVPAITETTVKQALQAILETLNALSKAIYGKKLPAVDAGLHSSLRF
jgi:hypothetical protein